MTLHSLRRRRAIKIPPFYVWLPGAPAQPLRAPARTLRQAPPPRALHPRSLQQLRRQRDRSGSQTREPEATGETETETWCRRPDLNWRHRAYEAVRLARFAAFFMLDREGWGRAGGNAGATAGASTAAWSSA